MIHHSRFHRAAKAPSLMFAAFFCVLALLLLCGPDVVVAAPGWTAKLDGRVRFYQQTEWGVVVAGTEDSLYGIDGDSGDILWRRKGLRLDEREVAPVPGTDFVLLTFEDDGKTRLIAADVMTGGELWRSDKVRGAVVQMAVEPESNLLAAVFVRDARGEAREGFKRRPRVHLFNLSSGAEVWEYELESEIEMMPAGWGEGDKTPYTLRNYHPPLFLDNRLYLFYEGVTTLEVRSGKSARREKFRVNEEGLALTEADPVGDERRLYTSGRGRVRAVSRATGEVEWEAKDLGVTPQMTLAGGVLYVRTGGQFTRLSDGEPVDRGPFGVSAIDAASGKVLWRNKGADKGITNVALPDESSLVFADRDDLITLDARTGQRRLKSPHRVERAAFVLLNERGEIVVGGRDEIAGFNAADNGERWRARHTPPSRGVLRTVGAMTARAASLYFRYGGAATTVFRGAQVLSAASAFRWSGLASRVTVPNLSALAIRSAEDRVADQFRSFGALSRVRQLRAGEYPRLPSPARADVEERLLDRLDPARQLEQLSRRLWHRRRLAMLRGEWMYFYTDLQGGRGLAGVNVNSGESKRAILLNDPDDRFISDEAAELLYVSRGDRLVAHPLNGGAESGDLD